MWVCVAGERGGGRREEGRTGGRGGRRRFHMIEGEIYGFPCSKTGKQVVKQVVNSTTIV